MRVVEHRPVARRYDLDWLRVLLFALLVPHHAAVGFVEWGEPIYGFANDRLAGDGLGVAIYWSHTWRLPSLFVIAGMGTWFATRRTQGWPALARRVARLLLPVAFGLLSLNVLGAVAIDWARGASMAADPDGRGTRIGRIMHLWFLVNLAAYTVIAWPLLSCLRARKVAAGWLFVGIAVGTSMIAVLAKPWAPAIAGDGYQSVWYFAIFVGGIVMGSRHIAILEWTARIAPWLVLFAGLAFLAELILLGIAIERSEALGAAMASGGWATAKLAPAYGPLGVSFALAEGLGAMLWCGGALGLAARYLNRPGSRLAELNEAVFPFYVLHFPIILGGLAILTRTGWPWALEFLLLTAGTYGATWLAWALVRRLGPVAVLVGGRTTRARAR